MFRNLATFSFDTFSDTAISKAGWYVVSNQAVHSLAGNDTLKGFVVPERLAGFCSGRGRTPSSPAASRMSV
jgi:hypothetical protein